MTDKDRIRLAEAMGWRKHFCGVTLMWIDPDTGTGMNSVEDLPDPFTDANDDYAVLEWMRGKCGVEPDYAFAQDEDAWQEFREELCEPEAYQIGDYAKACLRVLDEQ